VPLAKGGTLGEQKAWDVAAFMNNYERPQDRQWARASEPLK